LRILIENRVQTSICTPSRHPTKTKRKRAVRWDRPRTTEHPLRSLIPPNALNWPKRSSTKNPAKEKRRPAAGKSGIRTDAREALRLKDIFGEAIDCCRPMPVGGGSLEFIDGTPDRVLRGTGHAKIQGASRDHHLCPAAESVRPLRPN